MLPGVGPVLAKSLVSYCGSVDAVFRKRQGQLEESTGIGKARAEAIVECNVMKRGEEEAEFIRRHNIRSFFYLDADYPVRLKNCDDSPVLLFFKGKCELNAPRIIALVGTRNAT